MHTCQCHLDAFQEGRFSNTEMWSQVFICARSCKQFKPQGLYKPKQYSIHINACLLTFIAKECSSVQGYMSKWFHQFSFLWFHHWSRVCIDDPGFPPPIDLSDWASEPDYCESCNICPVLSGTCTGQVDRSQIARSPGYRRSVTDSCWG